MCRFFVFVLNHLTLSVLSLIVCSFPSVHPSTSMGPRSANLILHAVRDSSRSRSRSRDRRCHDEPRGGTGLGDAVHILMGIRIILRESLEVQYAMLRQLTFNQASNGGAVPRAAPRAAPAAFGDRRIPSTPEGHPADLQGSQRMRDDNLRLLRHASRSALSTGAMFPSELPVPAAPAVPRRPLQLQPIPLPVGAVPAYTLWDCEHEGYRCLSCPKKAVGNLRFFSESHTTSDRHKEKMNWAEAHPVEAREHCNDAAVSFSSHAVKGPLGYWHA